MAGSHGASEADGVTGTGTIERLCRACVELVPVDGTSVSLISDSLHQQTLYASDEISGQIEELQFSLGEGPCFEAFDTRRPVLIPDVSAASPLSWPVFASELAALGVGAIYAFPLQSGATRLGAIDLYRREPGWLTEAELAIVLEIVDLATQALLAVQTGGEADSWLAALPLDRQQVHQATGMLIAEFDLPAAQALARLRGYAYSAGRLVDDVARDLVARRIQPNELES